ncbi:hypothetical protein LN050_07365 [Comamonadaceae bacterium M7527]|nr:hypothetical protein LN050_07365 [Comamonadaceae bacterium M7527]
MTKRWLQLLSALLLASAMTACGMPRLVDTEVSTFNAAATEAQLRSAKLYWLERLPSQTSEKDQRMAAMARTALQGAGLQEAPSRMSAELLVTLTTNQAKQDHAPFEAPPVRTGFWFGTAGSGITFRFGEPATSSWYQRSLHWVFRNRAGDVLQEIKGVHDARWSDDDTVWQAMLNASLTDFPNGTDAPRVIKTDIPR